MSDSFSHLAHSLVSIAGKLHARGWLMGTSGNLSAVVEREPLQLAITPSGADKGEMTENQILLIDQEARAIDRKGKPSDESLLHIEIVKNRSCGAVIHTHSVWSTMLSDYYSNEGGIAIEGYEMLKGLQGTTSHEHREWIPIIDNSQDMYALADSVKESLAGFPNIHAFLLRRHGLYTWGRDLSEAKRHVEILEFLMETIGRSREFKAGV
jgi:methylthioribulose-1-phosphate dehydratase